MRLLIVDDEWIHVDGMKKLLGRQFPDAELGAETDGRRALAAMQREVYDIVVTDIRMPIMDGLEMIERWRDGGHEPGSKPTFVVLSSYSEFEYARSALRLGVFDYLLKPTNPKELVSVIKRIWEDERATEADQRTERDAIDSCLAYLKGAYMKDISLDHCAQMLHFSPSYFSVLFKNTVGQSFSKHLQAMRMDKAKELLILTDHKVYEIAHDVGYGDEKYFNRLFKRTFQATPEDYRRQYYQSRMDKGADT